MLSGFLPGLFHGPRATGKFGIGAGFSFITGREWAPSSLSFRHCARVCVCVCVYVCVCDREEGRMCTVFVSVCVRRLSWLLSVNALIPNLSDGLSSCLWRRVHPIAMRYMYCRLLLMSFMMARAHTRKNTHRNTHTHTGHKRRACQAHLLNSIHIHTLISHTVTQTQFYPPGPLSLAPSI